jgi:hypothetical protein
VVPVAAASRPTFGVRESQDAVALGGAGVEGSDGGGGKKGKKGKKKGTGTFGFEDDEEV